MTRYYVEEPCPEHGVYPSDVQQHVEHSCGEGERRELALDYGRADAAFNEALKLAGAEAHGPTLVVTHFIVNAALSGDVA